MVGGGVRGRRRRRRADGCSQFVSKRCYGDLGPRMLRVVSGAGTYLTELSDPSLRSSREDNVLEGVLKDVNRQSTMKHGFLYRYKGRVFVKSGSIVGSGYAVVSRGRVLVKGRILVTPGMRFCATARPVGCGREFIRG